MRRPWLVPTALIALIAVPVLAGGHRVFELAGGASVTPENARFFAMPVPVLVHIFSASLFCVAGALQFVPGLRRRWPRWHRLAGRVLVPAGLAAAMAGIWMTLYYPLPHTDDALLDGFRLLFGSAMILSLLLGFAAIRRRDIAAHRAWMMRGYAIAMGAGTQVLTVAPVQIVTGSVPVGVERALLMAAAWVINLAVAEYVLRRRSGRRPSRPAAAPLSAGA
jgi:uncharacterized membrane protein